jgi:hypothetical protein
MSESIDLVEYSMIYPPELEFKSWVDFIELNFPEEIYNPYNTINS